MRTNPVDSTFQLQISPIPKPLHRINLRSVLKASEWKAIRQSLIRERGLICETCRAKTLTADLHAHEIWSYDTTTSPATATLTGISLQCKLCHGCEHFFRMLLLAKKGGVTDWQIEELVQHFCEVNATSPQVFSDHAVGKWNEWVALSELGWHVDLRPYSDQTLYAEPASDVGPLIDRTLPLPWEDPSGHRRRSEFLSLLTQLSTEYGYWIGRTSIANELPLHVLRPGTQAGCYQITRTLVSDTEQAEMPLTLSWSADPKRRRK